VRAGTFALEKGAGVVNRAQHMFVSKDNTLDKGTPSEFLYRAQECADQRVDFLKTVCIPTLGRRERPSVRAGTFKHNQIITHHTTVYRARECADCR